MPPRSHALSRRELGARAKGMKSMSTRGEGKGSRDLRPLLVANRWSSERLQSMSLAVHLLFRMENKCTNSLCCTWSETGCWVGLGTRLNHCMPHLPVPVGGSCDHHLNRV